MDNFLEFLIIHLPVYANALEGAFMLILLWNIDQNLEILITKRSKVDDEVKKISITLMGSLNEIRKLLRPEAGRNRHQK
jgi:hypothetical protein